MKKILIMVCITFIFSIFIFICYGESNNKVGTKGYMQLVNTFENIGSNFKFYNIKANAYLDKSLSQDEMRDICMELISNMGLEESKFQLKQSKSKSKSQVYVQITDKYKNISIIVENKDKNQSYIIVDILENKVYKDIVDIYDIVENSLKIFTKNVNIYTCLAGEYKKRLQLNKYDDILKKILYNMNAKEIDRVEEENFMSVTAYSKLITTDYLQYLGNKVNLNIGIRYSENDEKTLIYIATPIIKLDY